MASIFIAIPSLFDLELLNTVDSIYKNSSGNNDIFLGIHYSYTDKKDLSNVIKGISNNKNIRFVSRKLSNKNNKNAGKIGVGLARCSAMSLYKDEDYVLQIDSHTSFDKDWDITLINLLKEAKEFSNKDKVLLTAYPGPYFYESDGSIFKSKTPRYPMYIFNEIFRNTIPGWVDDEIYGIVKEKFVPAIKICAGFIFGEKDFGKNSGTDLGSLFFEEEPIQTMNLVYDGFSLIYPNINDLPITHLYYQNINEFSPSRKIAGDYYPDGYDEQAGINYLEYINNYPEKAKKFYEYSKVHPKLGSLKSRYIPEEFL